MSTENRYISFDRVRLNKAKIIVDDDDELVVRAILASEIVQKYADGFAYKPADELEKAAWTADGRWVKMFGHPTEGTIQKVEDISGKVDNTHFVKNLVDHKTGRPNRRGMLGDVHLYKHNRGRPGLTPVPSDVIEQVKNGDLVDVSIGFTFSKDSTPGVWGDAKYDYVQRNLMIDHLAAPLVAGRCPSPFCGLGQDSASQALIYVAGDPWEETEKTHITNHRPKEHFVKDSLHVIEISEGVRAVVGCLPGKNVEEVQSYLFNKKQFSGDVARKWFSERVSDFVKDHGKGVIDMSEEMTEEYAQWLQKCIDEGKTMEQCGEEWKNTHPGQDCVICGMIDSMGSKRFSALLVRKFGLDIHRIFRKDQDETCGQCSHHGADGVCVVNGETYPADQVCPIGEFALKTGDAFSADSVIERNKQLIEKLAM